MKVVHIINNLSMGGAEKLMSTLLPELKKLGIDIELICINSLAENAIISVLESNQISIHSLSSNESIYHPKNILLLAKLLKKINPDIVHVHLFPAIYWASLVKIFFRLKFILMMTEHSTSNRRMSSDFWKWIDKIIYKQYHSVICISRGVEEIINKYIPSINTVTIFNGINLEPFQNPNPNCVNNELKDIISGIKSNPNNKILLSIGRLVHYKNQETLIRIANQLPSNFILLICGEGEMRLKLETLILEFKLSSRVILLGNQLDIPYLVKESDIGILTSTVEGFGLAAAEMMAGGLPVASSNIPGLNEVSADESLQTEPSNIKQFVHIIEKLIIDETYYLTMKEKCKSKSVLFSIQKMALSYINVYNNL